MNTYKIYSIGNYFRIEDFEKQEIFNGLSKEVFIDKNSNKKGYYRIFNVVDWESTNSLSLEQLKKQDGSSYTLEEWETFYTQNTGNFNSGGVTPQTWSQTLGNGRSTSGINPLINAADAIELENGSKLRAGSRDNGFGGGISRECVAGYEDQWENGVQYYYWLGGTIIRATSINNVVPDSSFDDSKGWFVGSIYFLANTGVTYRCKDSTTENAVWEIVSEGKIVITDLLGQAFTDLSTARTWISAYYVGSYVDDVTNESFLNGVFKLTLPSNSSLANIDGFCSNATSTQDVQFEDKYGLVNTFANGCFQPNSRNNIFGKITVGDSFLKGASPSIKNEIYQIESCGSNFGSNYFNRIDVNKFGVDETSTLPSDILNTSNLVLVVTDYSNKYINSGRPDGDVLNVIANLADGNPQSKLSYDGVDEIIKIFFSTTGSGATTFTIPIGQTMNNINYVVGSPTAGNMLSAVNWVVDNKTPTSFDITSLTALIGLIEIETTVTP